MSTDTPERTEVTRVDDFVELFRNTGVTVYEHLADVYQHYLDNVEAINDGSFDIGSIPHFGDSAKPVIHGGVMFGITWGKESEVTVVTTNDGKYVSLYGVRETAANDVDLDTHTLTDVTPNGRTVEDEFNALQNSQTELMRELGDAIEYLHGEYAGTSRDDVEAIDNEAVLADVPHLDDDTSTVLLYSMLFGRQWEYSDPGLWVVTENGVFDSLHGLPSSASERELQGEAYTAEAVTPIDNDRRQASGTIELTEFVDE